MPSHHHHARAMTGGIIMAVVLIIAAASVAAHAAGSPAAGAGGAAAKSPTPGAAVPAPPVVGDTRANLQRAFANEMNAKERYTTYAKVADREGYAAVAQLFRACATAEQVHADRHVHAIAVVGGEARVLLDRVYAGTTAENLESAIDSETYEATELYPALLAEARAEQVPDAVRSMAFALATEREHEKMLTEALATLDQRPAVRPLYVCSYCGRTIATLDAGKCPTCFTDAKKFIRVGDATAASAAAPGGGPAAAAVPVPPRK
jgi:rubrerythrin